MSLCRRQFLNLTAGVGLAGVGLAVLPRTAWAEAYPARPVRIVVGFPPGGTADIIARLIGQRLSERLGQPFIVENRPGASTNLATETVVKAPPDGYTLLLVNGSGAINTTLFDNLPFNFIRDIAPVAGIDRVPLIMEVNPSFPAKTVPEFIAYAKANPGKINMASTGSGSTPDLAGELFRIMANINVVRVQYRGSAPALIDLLGGQVQVMFDLVSSSIDHIRAGRLRPLAITTATRLDALPNVPPVGDFVPGYEASSWQGLGAPRQTPIAVIDTLNSAVNATLGEPGIKQRLADLGSAVLAGTPPDFGKLIANETEKWGKVIQTANIKPD